MSGKVLRVLVGLFLICFGLIVHSFYAKSLFLHSNASSITKLTSLNELAYNASIYDNRFFFEKPHTYHPNMPQISHRAFVYE